MITKSIENGALTLSHMNTTCNYISWMHAACCLVVGLWLGLGLFSVWILVSGLASTCICIIFPLSLSLSRSEWPNQIDFFSRRIIGLHSPNWDSSLRRRGVVYFCWLLPAQKCIFLCNTAVGLICRLCIERRSYVDRRCKYSRAGWRVIPITLAE